MNNHSTSSLILSFTVILFCISSFVVQPTIVSSNSYIKAVKNLKEGWRGETIYQTNPLGPISICATLNDVLILDKAAGAILSLDINGETTIYVSTGNFSFDAIHYQPNHNRLIVIGSNLLYFLNEGGTFEILQEYSPEVQFSTLTVDNSDDSIYVGAEFNDSIIYHFNATGHMLGPILKHIQGCSQIAIHPNNTILYYTETYRGRVNQLNLISNVSAVLVADIGILGTGEGIGITVDSNGTLYYYTAEGNALGLNKYDQEIFINVMSAKYGTGPIFWSELHQAILCSAGGGACIVKYDLTKAEGELLTPTINTRAIIETNDSRILFGIEDHIFEVVGTEVVEFSSQLPGKCNSLILTKYNEVYFGIINDTLALYKLESNGAFSVWFQGNIQGFLHGMKYDKLNHALIISIEVFSDSMDTQLWRIPIDNPLDYELAYELENITRTSFTLDYGGNIFLLERKANILYKIPNGSNLAEIQFTTFIEADYMVEPNLGYSSIEDGIIVCRNDDLQVWPLSREQPFLLAENNIGIDNDGLIENQNQELVVTHSGQIYKLIYEGTNTSETLSTSITLTNTIPSSQMSPFLSIELFLLIIGLISFLRKRKIFI
ncbi:MAG: hypothetical protein EAX86_11255 [Candidatus Heimdallarchaeota archaeon]|nr:hypothetical protein [Candidatus Heimdallarchaeota archaeon]